MSGESSHSESRFREYSILLAILVLGFGLRVYFLDDQSLWWDELSTWHRAIIALDEMMGNLLAKRNHVPLYFLLMRFWVQIGATEFVLRYFSVIWGLVGLAFIYRVGKLVGGRRVGSLVAFFLAISPFQVWYSREARMYSLAVAAVLAAHWFLIRALRRDRMVDWTGYGFSMLVAVSSHYYPLLLLPAHYVFFVFHFRRASLPLVKWLVFSGLACLPTLAWIGISLSSGVGKLAAPPWIPKARLYEPLLTLLVFSSGRSIDPSNPAAIALLVLIFLLASFAVLVYGRHFPSNGTELSQRHALVSRLLVLWLVTPMVIALLVSIAWPPLQVSDLSIYVDRYLIIVQPAILLLAAWGLVTFANRFQRRRLPALVALLILLLTLPGLKNLFFEPDYGRENWRSALATLDREAQANDVIFVRPDHLLPLAYYGDDTLNYLVLPSSDSRGQLDESPDSPLVWGLSSAVGRSNRAWLITHFYVNDPHGFAQSRNQALSESAVSNPQKAWMEANFNSLGEWDVIGINLALYDLTGARVQGQKRLARK